MTGALAGAGPSEGAGAAAGSPAAAPRLPGGLRYSRPVDEADGGPAGEAPPGHITILGGGPAGLAVALYAHRAGVPFTLFERSAELGGLCRTFEAGPHRYDSGAHRFHDRDADITRDVRDLLGDELASVEAPSQIHYRGRFIDFPPGPLSWLRGQGIASAAQSAMEIAAGWWRPRPERTFEDVAVNRYGFRLAKPLLLDYSEKLWGLPASELAPDVATSRLSGLTFRALLVELFLPGRKSAHLDGGFLYPHSGYGAICGAIASRLPPDRIHREHEVAGLEVAAGRIRAVRFKAAPPREVMGRVVNTLPLSLVTTLLGASVPEGVHRAAASLCFRHVRLVFLRLGVSRCTANATIYLPDPRHLVSRVSEPKNRSTRMAPEHETSLLAEIPCSTGHPTFSMDDAELAQRVINELSEVGLIAESQVIEWRHHLLPNAYPVHAVGASERIDRVRAGLAAVSNLDLLGRGGRFWYSHLHDQMRTAKDYVASWAEAGEKAALTISPHILKSASRL